MPWSIKADDEKFFDRVYKFLLAFDKNISLDAECEKLKEKNEIESAKFEQAVKKASKIKKNPRFSPNETLWKSIRIYADL